MTIRQQIFAFVVPLFAFSGAVGAIVSYKLQTEALDRAFYGEVRSLAVTLAEFVEPGDIKALAGGRPFAATRLGAVMDRFDRWQIIGRFYMFDSVSHRVLADTVPTGSILPTAGELKGLAPGEVRSLGLAAGTGGLMRISVVTPASRAAAIVGMNFPASSYVKARDAIRTDSIEDFLVASAIGLCIAWILSAFVTRQVARLEAMVGTLGTEAFPQEEDTSIVQEATDLGISLNVMHNVLSETLERTRSLLPESDRYRSERSLALDLQRQIQAPEAISGAGAEAVWFSVGTPMPAAFAGIAIRGPRSGVAYAGFSGAATAFATALRGGAASAYLSDALARRPLEEALAEARSLFGLERLAAVEWEGALLRTWWAEGDGLPALAGPLEWRGETLVGVNALGPANRAKMDLYLARYASRGLDRVRRELPALLDGAESGAALILRARQA